MLCIVYGNRLMCNSSSCTRSKLITLSSAKHGIRDLQMHLPSLSEYRHQHLAASYLAIMSAGVPKVAL